MKTMQCKDLGGTCAAELQADSWNEMAKAMAAHVHEMHPVAAQEMEEMQRLSPTRWGREMKPRWDATPDT